jgi:hypothetical protein
LGGGVRVSKSIVLFGDKPVECKDVFFSLNNEGGVTVLINSIIVERNDSMFIRDVQTKGQRVKVTMQYGSDTILGASGVIDSLRFFRVLCQKKVELKDIGIELTDVIISGGSR